MVVTASLRLPAASVARTSTECVPGFSLRSFSVEAHGVAAAPSTEQVVTTAAAGVVSSIAVNVTVAVRLARLTTAPAIATRVSKRHYVV